jgi:hypothetical protein
MGPPGVFDVIGGMHESLVLRALWRLDDDDAARHLREAEEWNALFRAGLTSTSDLVLELQCEAFSRKFPDVGDPDPTWVAWAAWAEVARLREVTAGMEG